MKKSTIERFFAACKMAATIGATLTESGAPRDMPRYYLLKYQDGTWFESDRLSEIEKRLLNMTHNAAHKRQAKETRSDD